MQNKQINQTINFSKKYQVLETSLKNFIYWRDQYSLTQHVPSSSTYNVNITLEQELLLVKKLFLFSNESNSHLNDFESNQQFLKFLDFNFSPKNFFGTKLPFFQYWIIPLLGFIVFNLKRDENSSKFILLENKNQVLENREINASYSKNINNLSFTRKFIEPTFNRNSLTNISFANEKIKEEVFPIFEFENSELKNLCLYYLQFLQKNLDNAENPSNLFQSNHFLAKKQQLSSIYWNWLSLNKNSTIFKNNLEKNNPNIETRMQLFKMWNFYDQNYPAKLNPLTNELNYELSPSYLLNSNIQNNLNKIQNPIESYKISTILLDELLKQTIINTNLIISENLNKKTSNFQNHKKSKLLNLIEKLTVETTIENYVELTSKLQNNKREFLPIQKELINSNFNQTKFTIQKNLDNLMLLKLLKFKTSSNVQKLKLLPEIFPDNLTLKREKQRSDDIVLFKSRKDSSTNSLSWLVQELVSLKKLQTFNSEISRNTEDNLLSLNHKAFTLTKKTSLIFKKPIFLNHFKKSQKNLIEIFELKTPILMSTFNLEKTFSLNSKSPNTKNKNSTIYKQEPFSVEWTRYLTAVKNNDNSRMSNLSDHFNTQKNTSVNPLNEINKFQPNNKQQNKEYNSNFYKWNAQQGLNILATKLKIILDNETQTTLNNQHLSKKIVFFSDENTPLEYLTKETFSPSQLSNLPNKNKGDLIHAPKNTQLFFKLKPKSEFLNTFNINKTYKKLNTEKLLKNYLSIKLNAEKQLIKNPRLVLKNFRAKKDSIETLNKLKQRVKAKNQKLNQFPFMLKPYVENDLTELQLEMLKQTQNERKNANLSSFELKNLGVLTSKQSKTKTLNPNQLFKRIGFIFLTQMDKEQINVTKNEPLNFSLLNSQTLDQVQKQKAQQKKQRRKKQNLETRRRKKRKRFYPRPNWLRFHLYQNFLQHRHPKKLNESSLKSILKPKNNKIKKTLLLFKKRTYTNTSQNPSFSMLPIVNFSNMSTLQNSLSIRNLSDLKQSNYNVKLMTPSYLKKNNYLKQKIYRKNKQKWGLIIQDTPSYEKFSLQQISLMKSLPILTNQDFYKISNSVMSDFQRLCWKSYWLRSNLTPYIKRIQTNLEKLKHFHQVIYSESTFKKFFNSFFGLNQTGNSDREYWLSNISQLNWYLNYRNSFDVNPDNSFFSITNTKEKLWVYDQILNSRLSNIIKNVKINLKTSGQLQTKSFSQGHKKNEHLTKPPGTWAQNFYSLNSMFDNMLNNSEEKLLLNKPIDFSLTNFYIPQNSLATLRILWGLNQTNLLGFKQNNDIKQLWESVKIREQNKSNKTKKFILKNFKTLFPISFDNLCFQKTEKIYKKLSWNKKILKSLNKINDLENKSLNSVASFHNLKFQLKSNIVSDLYLRNNSNNLQTSNKYFLNSQIYDTINFKKSQKNSTHFWWSNQKVFPTFKVMLWSNSELNNLNNEHFTLSESILTLNTLWISAILFHLAILFSLLRISEIRSLLKFYFLVISKVSESYFGILNLVYKIFDNYKNQIFQTLTIMTKEMNFLPKLDPINLKLTTLGVNFENSPTTPFIYSNSFSQTALVNKFIIRLPKLNLKTTKSDFSRSSVSFADLNKFENSFDWQIFNPIIFKSLFIKRNSITDYTSEQKTLSTTLNNPLDSKNSTFIIEKFQTLMLLPIFLIGKYSLLLFDSSLNMVYGILSKIIDLIETFVMIIYKFLEKPAELLIDWIGQIFLIEWSNDIISFLPDLLDTNVWISFSKFSRGSRISPVLGFFIQRRLWCFMEIFLDSISRPDVDLLERQKKGIIFWDIWAEVLIQAAENYKMNLASFMTLKEEQELFMEKILEDSTWNWSSSSMLAMSPLLGYISKDSCSNISYSILNSDYFEKTIKLNSSSLNLNSTKFSIKNTLISNSKKVKKQNFLNFNDLISQKIHNAAFQDFYKESLKKDFRFDEESKQQVFLQPWKRWATNQSFTYQGNDTDLFVDLHPPKSFQHVQFLRSSELALQTLGPLVCQIYSGIFSNQISKNILIVGSPGNAKSLFIQALAGETELKIMTDHAQRYAIVQRGVAVGMKLLRDVFDAIALYTPCIFLMEEIHLIGERRPMLISDQENGFMNENIFGLDQEEVHEKNQLLYQWSRHNISHYRRPYKSDFSVMIPTNHFCFDLFLGISPPRIRQSNITPRSPLPIQHIEEQLHSQNANSLGEFSDSDNQLSEISIKSKPTSFLQLAKDNFFSPPATSPFLVFAIKEQQKLKPKKRVKQMPWGGLSVDQMNLLPKASYSVRLKVALLADLAIRNLSVKLDMITDLLVILDNVRSNRGFVVFATTHVPSLLDPALRRPGRFDETISLPTLPNLFNRWQILKTNLNEFTYTVDFLDYSLITSSLTETSLFRLVAQTKLSLFNTLIPKNLSIESVSTQKNVKTDYFGSKRVNLDISKVIEKAMHFNSDLSIKTLDQFGKPSLNSINIFGNNFSQTDESEFPIYSITKALKIKLEQPISTPLKLKTHNSIKTQKHYLKTSLTKAMTFSPFLTKNSVTLLSLTYFKIGSYFLTQTLANNQNSAQFVMWTTLNSSLNTDEFVFKELYSPKYELKYQLIQFFSGKISELFILNSSYLYNWRKDSLNLAHRDKKHKQDQLITERIFKPFCLNQQFQVNGGFDVFWKSATSFLLSAIQKRFLYQQNLVTTKLLLFEDFSLLSKPPSPPASSILMISKKYENLQRTHSDFQQKPKLSITEKLQIHQQQRLIKRLYQKPINKVFSSQLIPNRFTNFNSSWKELSYYDWNLSKFTSINKYYNSRILNRHKFHLINQWWNGQLAEHNIETTFLSDIDWRSMFVKSLGDLVIDFPDAEQYYNPRSRRWFMNSNSWHYWFNFDKTFSNEIASHFLLECFNKASKDLETHRESLDFYAYKFLESGVLKEIDLITIKSRFYLP